MTARRRGTADPKPVRSDFGRRRFLAGLGVSAAAAAYPKRLILLFSANGTLHERWAPTGTEREFTLGPILGPLERHRDKLVVLDGLEVLRPGPGDGHQKGIGCLWTGNPLLEGGEFTGGNGELVGWGGGISVDQHVADAIGNDTAFKSLEFGVQTGGANIWSRMSYAGPNQPIAPEDDPSAMFDRLFAELGSTDRVALERLKAERASVLAMVQEDLRRLEGRYGSADRVKIEAHLEAVSQMEKRNELSVPTCEAPVQDLSLSASENDNFPLVSRLMIDQLVMALACDLTRVASLQWSRSVSQVRFGWIDVPERHHDISHFGDDSEDMVNWITKINTWYAEEVAYLLDRMAEIPEGDGTLLDNSIVVWGNELSRGNSHGNRPVPFVLAGGGGGAIETGRFLQYDRVPHNRLLVSLSQAMGLDTQRFGDNDDGMGGLPGLT